jgi:hypothetical protein
MAATMRIHASVDLDEVVAEFSEEDILKALRVQRGFRGEGVLNGFAIAIDVQKVMPALLDDLRMTQVKAEKAKDWNAANRLCDLRESIERAWIAYRGEVK